MLIFMCVVKIQIQRERGRFRIVSKYTKKNTNVGEGRGANGEDMSVMLGCVRKIGTRREVVAVKRRLVRHPLHS